MAGCRFTSVLERTARVQKAASKVSNIESSAQAVIAKAKPLTPPSEQSAAENVHEAIGNFKNNFGDLDKSKKQFR